VKEKFMKGSMIAKIHRVKEKFVKGSVIAKIPSCEEKFVKGSVIARIPLPSCERKVSERLRDSRDSIMRKERL
jgi:hypothetical protein